MARSQRFSPASWTQGLRSCDSWAGAASQLLCAGRPPPWPRLLSGPHSQGLVLSPSSFASLFPEPRKAFNQFQRENLVVWKSTSTSSRNQNPTRNPSGSHAPILAKRPGDAAGRGHGQCPSRPPLQPPSMGPPCRPHGDFCSQQGMGAAPRGWALGDNCLVNPQAPKGSWTWGPETWLGDLGALHPPIRGPT